MPFDDDDDLPIKPKTGIKSQGKSIFDKAQKKPSYDEFEKKAIESNKTLDDYESQAKELSSQFKKLMDDKTLPQNKNLFVVDIEKEIISKMSNLAIQINQDQSAPEGMGSVGWIALLLRHLILQKDRVNVLEHKLSLYENKTNEQDSLIQEILSKLNG